MKTKVKKYITYLPVAVISLTLTSCNDFPNKYPDGRMDLENPTEVSQLLVNAYSQTHPAYLTEMHSGNTGEQLHSTWSTFDRFQEQAYQRKDIDDVSNTEMPYQLWSAHYVAILACNEAVEYIEHTVKDTQSEEDYRAQLGEALLCRVSSVLRLSIVFCQAYDKTTTVNQLGLPYPTEPEKVVGRLIERGTLAELYQRIEADMPRGIVLVDTKYAKSKFHFTKRTTYVFAMRFYLCAWKCDKAVKYTNTVLGDQPADIPRNWAEWNRLGPSGDVQPNAFANASNNANIILLPVSSQRGVISIPIQAGSKYAHGELISKNETLQVLGPWGDSGSILDYTVLYNNGVPEYCLCKIPYAPKVIDATAEIGVPYGEYAVLGTDITLFEHAEAYALLGQYDKALKDINTELTIFSKNRKQPTFADTQDFYGSMAYYTLTKLTPKKKLSLLFTVGATIQEPLLQCLSQLKRLVTIHEGFRLRDVKCYGTTMCRRKVDVQSNVTAVTDSMKVGDPRLATQLPQDVITAGVKPNPCNNQNDRL